MATNVYIAITRHAFGWGDTVKEAKATCRLHAGTSTIAECGMVVYETDPKSEISTIDGSLSYPTGGFAPVIVEDTRRKIKTA